MPEPNNVDDAHNQVLTPDDDAVEDVDQTTEVVPVTYSITSYGADYPVDGLVKRLVSGDIFVPSVAYQKSC